VQKLEDYGKMESVTPEEARFNAILVQRYFGRSCSFRFSESTLNSEVKLDITRQVFKKPEPREDFSESDVLPIDLSVEPPP